LATELTFKQSGNLRLIDIPQGDLVSTVISVDFRA
jgi:hypothetical protein